MRVFLSLLTMVFVAGCTSEPSIMPQGSARAQEEYKTVPGPEPRGEEVSYGTKVYRSVRDGLKDFVDTVSGEE